MAATTAAVVGAGVSAYGAYADSQSAGDALDTQAAQNKQNLDFIKQQGDKARRDALTLQPYADNALQTTSQYGADVMGDALKGQIGASRKGNFAAQETLLAGLGQQNNAILGMPVDYGALQAKRIPTQNIQSLVNPQLPDLGLPSNYQSALAGSLEIDPGDSNRMVVAQARNLGLVNPEEYQYLQLNFDRNPGVAGGEWWGKSSSPDELIENLGTHGIPIPPERRALFERLFFLLHPPGANESTGEA